jgi:cytochrome P450
MQKVITAPPNNVWLWTHLQCYNGGPSQMVKTTDDKRFIRNEVMNVFFPARDTAAILTSNVLFMLARHTDVWDKLRAEVLGIGSEKLTFELLKSLKYMQAVMNESTYPQILVMLPSLT